MLGLREGKSGDHEIGRYGASFRFEPGADQRGDPGLPVDQGAIAVERERFEAVERDHSSRLRKILKWNLLAGFELDQRIGGG